MTEMNKNLKILPIIGISLTLLGYFYLMLQTYKLNERRSILNSEIEELETIKLRLTNEVKLKDTLLTLQDKIISQSSDEETVKQGTELRNRMRLPNAEFFTVTEKEDTDVEQALRFELEGFNYLFDRDIEKAIGSFRKSENSYNGFHSVYEIAVYLERNKSRLMDKNSKAWAETYEKILSDYSWKMPKEIRAKLVELTSR